MIYFLPPSLKATVFDFYISSLYNKAVEEIGYIFNITHLVRETGTIIYFVNLISYQMVFLFTLKDSSALYYSIYSIFMEVTS